MLQVGDKAPDFTATLTTGEPFSLSELRGRPVALFFLPIANTLL